MSDDLNIRMACRRDADALLDLYTHLSRDSPPCPSDHATRVIDELARYQGSAILVGAVGNMLVASCTLIVIPNITRGGLPYALVENVVTHAEHRRKGFGKAILDAACDRAWAQNCYKIMLSTGSRAPETLSFYEYAGFAQSRTGFQKRRVSKRPE